MKKRMVLMLVAAAAFIAVLAIVKTRQVKTAIAQHASFQMPPEAVTTVIAKQESWPQTQAGIGTVAAVRGVMISADLPGIVEKISFESGKSVREGEVLVLLDTRQERAQLAAAESQRGLTRLNLERQRGLNQKGVTSQADFDRADAEAKQAEAGVGEIRATIDRKTIRAPFSGELGIRQVNVGQYLIAGAPIVQLQSLDPIYVNFSVPQQQIATLLPGTEVTVTTEKGGVKATGRLTAIDSVVDPATRNIQIQATLANPAARLRPGMFVQTQSLLGASNTAIAVPASAISYAPYGDSVFIVEEMKSKDGKPYRGVRQQFVKIGAGRGDQVAVVSGVTAGEEIVSSGVFKLRNGAAVQVNNKVQPGNNPAPKPENS